MLYMENHPLYGVWVNMKCRCYVKKSNRYNHYGGRGIKICARWVEKNGKGFWNFVEDMGERPANPVWWRGKRHYYSLNRKDNNGNYEPSNCEWASAHEQALNRQAIGETPNIFWDRNYDGWAASIQVSGRRFRKRSKSRPIVASYLKQIRNEYGI